jgi:hypothetical protein
MRPWPRGFRHAGLDPASRMPYHIDHILDSGFRRNDGTEAVVPTVSETSRKSSFYFNFNHLADRTKSPWGMMAIRLHSAFKALK